MKDFILFFSFSLFPVLRLVRDLSSEHKALTIASSSSRLSRAFLFISHFASISHVIFEGVHFILNQTSHSLHCGRVLCFLFFFIYFIRLTLFPSYSHTFRETFISAGISEFVLIFFVQMSILLQC